MIDEAKQDNAAAYALGMLTDAERELFEQQLAQDPELRALVASLEETSALLALAPHPERPPASLRDKVLAAAASETQPSKVIPVRRPGGWGTWIPWAIAAALAVCSTSLWIERAELRRSIIELQGRDELAQVTIASLGAQVSAYERGAVLVVWNAQRQQGVVKFTGLPPQPGKDYQLWVIDPKAAVPVSAGVITPDANGFVRASFTPKSRVSSADKFAVSIEPKGGSETPRGDIVFVGS